MSSAEQYQLYANAAPDQSGHDVILHTLDTWRSHTNQDGVSRKLFFGSGNFTGTESLWNGTPLIFGTRHPKTLLTQDLKKALEESDGRVVGSFTGAETVQNGTARFTGSFQFTDSEVRALHNNGELQFSSGFIADVDGDGKLVGKVKPDHILIFKKSKDGLQPQDGGAMFLNARSQTMDSEELKGLLTRIMEAIKGLTPANGPAPVLNASNSNMTEELNKQVTLLNAQVETLTGQIAEKDATIEALNTKVQAFEDEKKQAEAKAQEDAWQNIKTNILPPGLTATPELEKEQKDKWLADKDGFYCNAVAEIATRPQPKGKEGSTITNAAGADSELDALDLEW